MSTRRAIRPIRIWTTFAIAVLLAGCGGGTPKATQSPAPTFPAALTASPYRPQIDPARFTTTIDNPYFPLTPGTTYLFEGTSDGERETDTVTVTSQTKKILGVTCVVVRDEVKVAGERAELTFDWYAQDLDGNVWYFGEASSDYENGQVVSTKGSWEAGVDGALPGVVMPGKPEVGLQYRQEYYAGEAEDQARVVALDGTAKVPYGSYRDVLVTEDSTPLEPTILERKYYAKGIGVVLERHVKGGQGLLELVDVTRASG